MTKPKPLPPLLAAEPFIFSAALRAGVTVARMRAGDLSAPTRAIRVPSAARIDLPARCRPYLELLPDAAISHGTAALLLGLVVPQRVAQEGTIHISRDPAHAVPRRRGITGHRLVLSAEELGTFRNLRVTAVHRTWLDLATVLTVDELVVAGDHIISETRRSFGIPRTALVRQADFERYVAGKNGVRGITKAREAMALMRPGVDSPPETRVRLLVHRAGLPEFTPNTPIFDATGHPAVWTDLGCRRYRTCIEYEGIHHLSPGQQSRDHERDLLTAELGWHQVKINRFDLAQGSNWVVGKVRHALRKGGWSPDLPGNPSSVQ
ncbi:endonuclease domain-containing protein [Arthrobacter sp. zg-Y1110]|uniref:endonuclease domain-containing protein n=1 Tax=Arthrobacter sp. zg-Y1110 TaxID=2886932 RepID=UPI001D14FE08|nr:hypothetical protein [Arthrobacter sp. zg-Y1110]MCC3292085.1 hypothetical protein [Arthrobacter sp. zg-Y1110]UWX85892.1 hypothetical protein N2K99_04985 [Arthrobacter sp. zg-Y1110]